MKIALLASTFLPRIGGAEVVVHNLALQLNKLGHEAAVVTWWGLWRQIRKSVPYRVLPLLPSSFTTAAFRRLQAGRPCTNWVVPQLLFYQKFQRFDIWNIHHAWPLGVLACPALRRRGMPVVVTPHGDDILLDPASQYVLLENPNIRKVMEACLVSANRITAISTTMRQAILDFNVDSSRTTDLPNGVDIERFTHHEERARTRNIFGLSPSIPLILSVGRNHPQKGYDLIPSAMAELMRRNVNCLWIIVGADSELVLKGVPPDVAARIRCLPPMLEPDLQRKGFDHLPSDALVDLYRACDLYVLPSRNEPFGMVVAEALAAGLPVVGTTGMGAPDMVTEGVGGFIVAKNDPAALAGKIEVLLRDGELRRRMGQYNREKARQYDWSVVARQYIACFEAAITAARGN